MPKNKKKHIPVVAVVLVCVGAIAIGAALHRRHEISQLYAQGESYIAQGYYDEAIELYELLDEDVLVEKCKDLKEDAIYQEKESRYNMAVTEYESGSAIKALKLFGELDSEDEDFRNTSQYISRCRLSAADEYAELGNYSDVFAILDTEISAESAYKEEAEMKYTAIADDLIRQAVDSAAKLDFVTAKNILAQMPNIDNRGNYLLQEISNREEAEQSFTPGQIVNSRNVCSKLSHGTLYSTAEGLMYIPLECDEDTKCLIYYPGGRNETLDNSYYLDLFLATAPNAIVLFLNTNGFYNQCEKALSAYDTLLQASLEMNIFLHDLVVCGASLGAYPALHAVCYIYERRGLRTSNCLILDAGNEWMIEEHTRIDGDIADYLALEQTKFYLFEESGVGMNKDTIRLLVNHGADVSIVRCKNTDHEGIVTDSINYGYWNYALGEEGEVVSDNYTLIPLTPDSTYPD